MAEINKHRENAPRRLSPISTAFALKFLRARDCDVDDAVQLYNNYMVTIEILFVRVEMQKPI